MLRLRLDPGQGLKAARDRFGLAEIETLYDVATGFDIDPLAVSLSKTTWVVTLADEIKAATSPIIIPIYHADSLFAVTPVTPFLPFFGESATIDVSLDGTTIKLPDALIQPEYRELFDRIIDWTYDEAIDAQAKGSSWTARLALPVSLCPQNSSRGTVKLTDLVSNQRLGHSLSC